jgi:hypothetical protein
VFIFHILVTALKIILVNSHLVTCDSFAQKESCSYTGMRGGYISLNSYAFAIL